MYYWKQWKRAAHGGDNSSGWHPSGGGIQSHARPPGLLVYGGTSIVQRALDNRWLAERGVPNLKDQWVEMHLRPKEPTV